jgi:hypothetical protein
VLPGSSLPALRPRLAFGARGASRGKADDSFLTMLSTKAARSWVRADRLEYPQGEAVADVPLLWDRSQQGLGSACASVRLRVRGNAGPGGGTGDAYGRSAINRPGTDPGARKRA